MTPEILINMTTALASIIGVIIGASLTAFLNWQLKTKESRLRVLEKIFDKRVDAHEIILNISKDLRTTVSANNKDSNSNLITYPNVLTSKEVLEKFIHIFASQVNLQSHWLDINLTRELYFIQDYLQNLSTKLEEFNDDDYIAIGIFIKQDFIDLAHDLEQQTMKFFEKDILKVNISRQKKHHKYKRKETMKRLNSMCLCKEWNLES